MRILDIDLDFFVSPIASFGSSNERLDDSDYSVDSIDVARSFLETQCRLSKRRKLPGACFEHHDDVFYHVRDLYASGELTSPIELHHVDAHSDIGGGFTTCWIYVEQELVHQPIPRRMHPKRGIPYLNSGNFVVFLAACGWLNQIHFVVPNEWRDDTNAAYLKDFSINSRALQLKRYRASDVDSAGVNCSLADIKHTLEPEIPFRYTFRSRYQASEGFDQILLTRSPGFTPKAADKLFDFINEYIK